MFCGRCGEENKEGRNFCRACGNALDVTCSSCGSTIDAGDLFCGVCGTAVAAGSGASSSPLRAQPIAERRLVSVLFVDLVRFTTYSEGRDPEEVRSTLSDYFARAEEIIGLYGGTVEKFIGDAVMAVWGTPTANEDDAERAVRAAMEVIEAVETLGLSIDADLHARASVCTGEVAVNLGSKGQGMVAGDLVNTAARLQSMADPGVVLVDRATNLGARKAIAFESIGSLKLKGKDEEVEAWRALRVFAGVGGRGAEGAIEPSFTGRSDELRIIKELLHSTGREQKPRLASLLGIGGIGKSRLIWEFYKYIDGLSDLIYWHQGRSPSYGEGVAFWALAEMVRMRARIAETDPDEVAAQKLDGWLTDKFTDQAERDWIRPLVAQLIGLEDAAETQREQLFAGWRRFFERAAEDGPVVLVFEDLHWADPGLIDFIEHLLAWSRNSPIFVLTLARPELLDRRPTWGVGQRNFLSIHLEPLTDEDMGLLLKSVAADLPSNVQTEIIARAEGVPLYAVEMIRMLVDRGDLSDSDAGYVWVGSDEHLDVPHSLHSLIASRLDSLDGQDRLLIQDASVLGKTFTRESLAHLNGRPVEELEARFQELARREIVSIDTDPVSPERGQYGFVQSLIREVAYQTLSKKDRSERHEKAAEFFASLDESDLYDVVATHYLQAYENSAKDVGASYLADRARDALRAAALRARSLGSHAQARSLFEMALEITDDMEQRARFMYEAGVDATIAGEIEAAIDLLTSTIEHLDSNDDSELRADAQSQLGKAYFNANRLEDSEAMLTKAVDQLHDPSTRAAASLYTELARVFVFKGDSEKGERCSSLAMPAAEKAGDVKLIANLLITRGVNSLFCNRIYEANALLIGGLDLSESHGLIDEQLRALTNISANQLTLNPKLAYETAMEGLEVARRFGMREAHPYLTGNALEAALYLWRLDEMRSLQAEVEELGTKELEHLVLTPARDALIGDFESADAALDRLRSAFSQGVDLIGQLAVWEATVALLRSESDDVVAGPADLRPGVVYSDALGVSWREPLWSRDLDRARSALQREKDKTINNEWHRARLLTIESGVKAIGGDRAGAIAGYNTALEAWTALEIPLEKLMCQVDFSFLVPGEESAAASEEAESMFASVENDAFARRLREARVSGGDPG